jgi:hypothetical protein
MELVAALRGSFELWFQDFPQGDFGGATNIACADHINMIKLPTVAEVSNETVVETCQRPCPIPILLFISK